MNSRPWQVCTGGCGKTIRGEKCLACRRRDAPPKLPRVKRVGPRPVTIAARRLTAEEIAEGALLSLPIVDRPVTRGDCATMPRPCPFVSCKWHLYLDVMPSGSIKLNFPGLEPDELIETCTLDVADRGGTVLEHVGEIANITRERVRQIEVRALARLVPDMRDATGEGR